MDIVKQVLQNSNDAEKYKAISVDKHLEVEFDVGTLMAIDKNDLDKDALSKNRDEYLLKLARDNAQLLFNKIWELPTERVEEAIVVKLPAPKFSIPRSKAVPKPRALTKWQEFAKEKGIQKKKKSKLSWDEQLNKWVPMYGFKRAQATKDKQWLLEVPQNADPMEDQFEKVSNAKTERVAKNELQRLRNIAKAKNVKIPRIGVTDVDKSTSNDLGSAMTVARSSTASVGRFQPRLAKEQDTRGIAAITPGANRKRKPPPVSAGVERSENLAIVDRVLNKRPNIDIDKAVARHINDEQISRSEEKTGRPKAGRGGKKKTRGKTAKGKGLGKRPGAKPAGGKGKRNPSKSAVGRKRR